MKEAELAVGEAKARFADCVRRVEGGETLVLTRHGRPVARLAPLETGRSPLARPDGDLRDAADVAEAKFTCGEIDRAVKAPESRREALARLLEEEVWPRVPEALIGKGVSKREREEILGLGEDDS